MACIILPTALLSAAQAAKEDIAKYADPHVLVNQLLDGGGGFVSSLNVLPNGDLLCICDTLKARAAGMGVKIAGKTATLGWISKDNGKTWGSPSLVLDTPRPTTAKAPTRRSSLPAEE